MLVISCLLGDCVIISSVTVFALNTVGEINAVFNTSTIFLLNLFPVQLLTGNAERTWVILQ